jgi:hypothetical protein
MRNFVFVGLLLCTIVTLSLPEQASGATMENERYMIEKSTINVAPLLPDEPTPPAHKEEKPYAKGKNYTVSTTKSEGFSFTVSQPLLDFGKLSATNPVIRQLELVLTSPFPFQIIAFEDHPLQLKSSKAIPDTTCDNGACSETTAANWTNTLTYGFGYSLESFDSDAYKQFADTSRAEPFQTILSGTQANNKRFKVLYKVNISGTQSSGDYTNTVTYFATPDF